MNDIEGETDRSFKRSEITFIPDIDNWLRRNIVSLFERSSIVRIFGFLVAAYSLYSLYITNDALISELKDRDDERIMRIDEKLLRTEERIERAWNSLLQRAGGKTGKGEHITFLVKNGRSLEGVDLSCREIGRFDEKNGQCIKEPIFTNVDISRTYDLSTTIIESMYKIIRELGGIPYIDQPPQPVQANLGKSTFIEMKALSATWDTRMLIGTTFLGSDLGENFFFNEPDELAIGYSDLSFRARPLNAESL